jgi:hypothetical protein
MPSPITGIERTPDWKDACQNRVLTDRHHQSISNPTGGDDIVEGLSDSSRRLICEFAMDRFCGRR